MGQIGTYNVICICILYTYYIHIYIYRYAHIHTYIHTYIHTQQAHTGIVFCGPVYRCVCSCVCLLVMLHVLEPHPDITLCNMTKLRHTSQGKGIIIIFESNAQAEISTGLA